VQNFIQKIIKKFGEIIKMNKRRIATTAVGIFGIAAFVIGPYTIMKFTGPEVKPNATIDYKLINNDTILDQIVTDKTNNEFYVMLSRPDETFEKCKILSGKEQGRWIYSKKENVNYNIDSGESIKLNSTGYPYNNHNSNKHN
jgi:hypothetical protein